METQEVIAKGLAERIGISGSMLKHEPNNGDSIKIEQDMPSHKEALKIVIDALIHKDYGVIKSMDEIGAVGHRVVHAGEKFAYSVVINDEVMDALKECIDLAPLHNPPNILGIEACKELMPGVPMVGVFDTAFHQSMSPYAYIYALPYEYYTKYGVRRYGFHGTSHKYVAERAANILEKDIKELKIVTCHLGNGASITAVKDGKSIDTSMGFTPLEGLAMGTRCGDIDPAICGFLVENEKLDINEVGNILNKKSGVLGISGISSDFRDIEKAAMEGNERASLALEVFAHKVKKYIGAYAAVMGGIDAVVFTAGLGENSFSMRESICEGLDFLGLKIDKEKNNIRGKEAIISTDDSTAKILLIPTNEELMIAKDTEKLIK